MSGYYKSTNGEPVGFGSTGTLTAREAAGLALDRGGFYATANDVRAGRRSIAWAIEHAQRSKLRRDRRGQIAADECIVALRNLPEPPSSVIESKTERHGMVPGSHERPVGPECRCGAVWDRWNDCRAAESKTEKKEGGNAPEE